MEAATVRERLPGIIPNSTHSENPRMPSGDLIMAIGVH